jgi:hypothetical protein
MQNSCSHPYAWFNDRSMQASYIYWQVREELESMGCQIKTSCEVKSVSSLEGGICTRFLHISLFPLLLMSHGICFGDSSR